MNDLDIKKFTEILFRLFFFFVACMLAYNLLKPPEYVEAKDELVLNKKTGEVFLNKSIRER